MENSIQRMKDGILVVGSTKLTGGTESEREVIETIIDGVTKTTTAMVKTIVLNEEERKEGGRLRTKAHNAVKRSCARTQYGMICCKENFEQLQEQITTVKSEISTFNEVASTCKLSVGFCFFDSSGENKDLYISLLKDISFSSQKIQKLLLNDAVDTLKAMPPSLLKGLAVEEILQDKALLNTTVARGKSYLVRQEVKALEASSQLLPEKLSQEVEAMIDLARTTARRFTAGIRGEEELTVDDIMNEVDIEQYKEVETSFLEYASQVSAFDAEEEPSNETRMLVYSEEGDVQLEDGELI